MNKKLANDVAVTNTEFTKLKSTVPDDTTPRENPDHQGPGLRGLRRPELETWTDEELRELVATLNVEDVAGLDREQLIEHILESRARRD